VGAALLIIAVLPRETVLGVSEPFDLTQPLADAELDTIRGGFETASGLQISFGFEQVTSINGVLQTRAAFYIPNLAGGRPEGIDLEAWRSKVIQNGPGNTVSLAPDHLSSAILNVVQNSLDNQVIQNITVIDLNVIGMESYRQHLTTAFENLHPF
jgi:hypothetical protein